MAVQRSLESAAGPSPSQSKAKAQQIAIGDSIARAESRIDWWGKAYLDKVETQLPEQFLQEARVSLPTFSSSEPSDVFASVTLQRIRLRHDQQVPEWDGGL
jgi:hypothetical protein